MDYYGLLFLYYLKGLSGKSVLRLFFNIEAGGTEQLLPENTSTPTTAPILADIQYPDGLRTDQYFTYRETPTTVSNKARIKTIKGNTLVWNQLIRNGNFADTSMWSAESGATLSISNNIATISSTTANNGIIQHFPNPLTVGHKYLIKAEFNVPTEYRCVIGTASSQGVQTDKLISTANTWTEVSGIETCTVATTSFYCYVKGTTYENVKIRNVMCFDLTQMGLDITDPSDFTSLFPLPYYAYNQGTLLSFMGNGIKTVGFNLFDQDSVLTSVGFAKQSDGSFYIQSPSVAQNRVLFENKLKYSGQFFLVYKYKYANTTSQGCRFEIHYTDGAVDQIYATGSNDFVEVSFISRANKVLDYINATYGSNIDTWWKDVCINISDPSKNGTYEPYTESTLSLPVLTYFATGMKSAGSVYDELTPTKAITRIGAVDLGSLEWETGGTNTQDIMRMKNTSLRNIISKPSSAIASANVVCINYATVSAYDTYIKTVGVSVDSAGDVLIYDPNYNTPTSAGAFKTAMSGIYLFYELAEYQETPITTEDANEALSLLMGKSVSSSNANQLINIITKGE